MPHVLPCPCGRARLSGDGPGPDGATVGPTPGVREAWHRGRPTYLVWLLEVSDAAVARRARDVARTLAASIVRLPEERLHVTVLVCGFPDELPAGLLRSHREAVEGLRAARARIHGPSLSYVSAHLDVCDCAGGIAAIRTALLAASTAAGHGEPRESDYHPHVTVGDFTGTYRAGALHADLALQQAAPPIALGLDRLRLVALDTRSHHAPYVEVVEDVALG